MTRSFLHLLAILTLAATATMWAQEPAQGGWRRVSDGPSAEGQEPLPPPPPSPGPAASPARTDAYGQPISGEQARADRPDPVNLPGELVLQPGTFVTVRLDQPLSSDRNQPGDGFSATLVQPIVVDGVVVAAKGQTVRGRIAEAERARAGNPSRLALELTSLTLVDGSQESIRSEAVARQGGTTPKGDQVGTVATTTALGTVIGGVAGRGTGAAIGAGTGALAGIAAVVLTKNRPTVLYPESQLTFRVESPVTISTARAPQAFRTVDPRDYEQPGDRRLERREPRRAYPPMWGGVWDPYWGPGYWGGPYWGGGVVIVGRHGRRW